MVSSPLTEMFPSNLINRSAPDKPGDTDVTTVRLRAEDLAWLRTLPNGVSYHIRQAVKAYRSELNSI